MNTTTLRGFRAATHYPISKSAQFASKPALALLHIRYASTPALKPISPSPPSPPPTHEPSSINGPLTTIPPPLDLPTRKPDQSLPSHLFSTGKAYLTFYKSGVKNIYTNYKLSKGIQSRLSSSNTTLEAAVKNEGITRSEFQLLYRNKHDLKRVPIFALVLLACGEFTPVVVIALTAVVPWTCRIPKQIDSDRRKLEKRRSESFRELTSPPPSSSLGISDPVGVLDKWQLRHINSSLGLSSKLWEWVFGPPEMVLKKRIRKRMEYLDMDDSLIRRAGGVGGMSEEEVRVACVERGIDAMDPSDASLKRILDTWLKSREKVGMATLLLTRPNVWPVRTKVPEPLKL